LLPPNDPDSTIDPALSVYDQIVQAFGNQYDILEDDDDEHDEHEDEPEEYATTITSTQEHEHAQHHQHHDRHRHHRLRRIDRRKLGAIVFADPSLRRTLNQLTHPRIRVVLVQRLLYGLYWSGKDFCVADVPLLYESGGPLRWIFGLVIMVTCRRVPGLQLQRLVSRNSDLTLEQCQQRIDSQMSLEQKELMSHIVIDNSGSREELAAAVERAREEMMMRVHGMGISLLQMLLILGGSVPVAVLSKMYALQHGYGGSSSSIHQDG
jgi:dephospho-CoA kinase